MQFTFKFEDYFSGGKLVRRPVVELTLVSGSRRQKVFALLDSGADSFLMPRSLAELLGLEFYGKAKVINGLGGQVLSQESTIDVEVSNGSSKALVKSVPVTVPLADFKRSTILAGRAVFFDYFDLCFRQADNQVTLSERGFPRDYANV